MANTKTPYGQQFRKRTEHFPVIINFVFINALLFMLEILTPSTDKSDGMGKRILSDKRFPEFSITDI